MNAAFYISAAVATAATLFAITRANAMHALLYLIVSLLALALVFFTLGAPFAALLEVIVYAGAIIVLFVFVIMMLNLNANVEPHKSKLNRFAATIAGGILMITLVGALKGAETAPMVSGGEPVGVIKNLGKALYNDFMLPFEISSILFLVAMVGAVMLGKKETKQA